MRLAPSLRRLTRGRALGLAVVAGLSLLTGTAQALLLVLVVRLGAALVDRGGQVDLDIGPLPSLELSAGASLAVLLGCATVLLAGELLNAWVASRLAASTLARERKDLFAAYSAAPWAVQAAERSGHLQELVMTNAASGAQAMLLSAAGLAALVSLAALVAGAVAVAPAVALAVTAALAVLAASLRPLHRRSRHHSEVIIEANLDLVGVLSEAVDLSQEVAAFGVADQIGARFRIASGRVTRWFTRKYRMQRASPAVFRDGALIVIIVVGAIAYAADLADVAAMTAIVLILVRALTYAQVVQATVQQLHALLPPAERVWREQEAYRARSQQWGDEVVERVESVELRDVTFSYAPDRPAVRALDFRVAAGEAVGVIGPSGAGKSTLVHLLLRLRDPDQGELLVNGRPATAVRRADFARRVAFVPQEPKTFHGTVADNIRFFRDCDGEAVARAARAAHLHDDVTAWPDGYDTLLGDRGIGLSGGQRQRLALARALLTDPDVLVLDEPTSALDTRSEALVQRTLAELKGRTALVIVAHRMATLGVCDRLVVLEGGRVEAVGTPEELRRSSAFYREVASSP